MLLMMQSKQSDSNPKCLLAQNGQKWADDSDFPSKYTQTIIYVWPKNNKVVSGH